MTNCPFIAKAVSQRCPADHGGLAKGCETYPPALVRSIVSVVRHSLKQRSRGQALGLAGALHQLTLASL
eukprot:4004477-Prorocentrum_lima.AAC.1